MFIDDELLHKRVTIKTGAHSGATGVVTGSLPKMGLSDTNVLIIKLDEEFTPDNYDLFSVFRESHEVEVND